MSSGRSAIPVSGPFNGFAVGGSMQRVVGSFLAGWKTAALFLGLTLAALLVTEVVGSLAGVFPAAAHAQEEGGEAAADAPADEGAAPSEDRQSYLEFFFGALGWRYTIAFLII